MSERSQPILFGFTTRPVPLVVQEDELVPPGTMSKPETIAAWRRTQIEGLAAGGQLRPYAEEIDTAAVLLPRTGARATLSGSLETRQWLWDNCFMQYRNVFDSWPVQFVGFSAWAFVTLLGVAPRLRDDAAPALPPQLWATADHCTDIGALTRPGSAKMLPWRAILTARGLPEHAASWQGPNTDAEHDLTLTIELATQLSVLYYPARVGSGAVD